MNDQPQTKKSLGQHWLYDSISLQAIVDAAEVTKNDVVLEIGPGPGSLTEVLVKCANSVIAVELDDYLAESLGDRVPATNLNVIKQDILSFNFSSVPAEYKIVANIPYYLTSNLIRIISETPNQPVKAVLLLQKEVAQRAAAGPGSMSLLSVSAQYYFEVSLGKVIQAGLFVPPPKVDSQILILDRRSEPLFKDIESSKFFQLAKAGFSQRRKTLLNSISSGLNISKQRTSEIFDSSSINPSRRAQTLSLEEWYQIYSALYR